MKFFNLLLVTILLVNAASLSAAKEETVYNWAYYPPVNEDLYDHLERNFKYPKEAWKKEHVNTLIFISDNKKRWLGKRN